MKAYLRNRREEIIKVVKIEMDKNNKRKNYFLRCWKKVRRAIDKSRNGDYGKMESIFEDLLTKWKIRSKRNR